MYYDSCDACSLRDKLSAVGDAWLCRECYIDRWTLFTGRDSETGWLKHGPGSRFNDRSIRRKG